MFHAPAPLPALDALYDIEALRMLESRAMAVLEDAYEPMRRAGQSAWRESLRHWPDAQRLLVVCGPGNNGGDGYMFARHAHQSGRWVVVMRLSDQPPNGPLARRAHDEYIATGGTLAPFDAQLPEVDLVVDALFGIGLTRAPERPTAALIEAINRQSAPVLALDVPSGVDANRGATPGAAVIATRTLEFIARKAGLRTGAALDHVGVLELADLALPTGIFAGVASFAEALALDDLTRWLRPRPRDSHKGHHGRVLCVGGDHGHGGAILLATEAALRSGAGLVDVVTRAPHVPALLARVPEAMAHAVADDATRLPDGLLEAASVIAIGPGLGQGDCARSWLLQALLSGKPLVLDADALNLLARQPQALPPDTVSTPHPGEAARLLGVAPAHVQSDRYAAALALCEDFGGVMVLKGAGSIIASPGRVPRVVIAGNPGMAVGGMGDVLSGVIAALRAQGLDGFDAASCGALLHAAAGDAAACEGGERGLLPSDLMPWLRRLSNPEARA